LGVKEKDSNSAVEEKKDSNSAVEEGKIATLLSVNGKDRIAVLIHRFAGR